MNYTNNLECNWLIEVVSDLPSVGFILKVTFNSLHLVQGGYLVCEDKLEFYDGNTTSLSNLLGSYCGEVPPEVVYSTGQLLYVKFQSDGRYSDRGFSFNVSAVLEGMSIITRFVYCSAPRLPFMSIHTEEWKLKKGRKREKRKEEKKEKRKKKRGKRKEEKEKRKKKRGKRKGERKKKKSN